MLRFFSRRGWPWSARSPSAVAPPSSLPSSALHGDGTSGEPWRGRTPIRQPPLGRPPGTWPRAVPDDVVRPAPARVAAGRSTLSLARASAPRAAAAAPYAWHGRSGRLDPERWRPGGSDLFVEGVRLLGVGAQRGRVAGAGRPVLAGRRLCGLDRGRRLQPGMRWRVRLEQLRGDLQAFSLGSADPDVSETGTVEAPTGRKALVRGPHTLAGPCRAAVSLRPRPLDWRPTPRCSPCRGSPFAATRSSAGAPVRRPPHPTRHGRRPPRSRPPPPPSRPPLPPAPSPPTSQPAARLREPAAGWRSALATMPRGWSTPTPRARPTWSRPAPTSDIQRPPEIGRQLLRGARRRAGRRADPGHGVLRRRHRRDPRLDHRAGLQQRQAGRGHPAGVARQRLGGAQRLGPAQRLGRPAGRRRHAHPRRPLQRQRPARDRRQRGHRDPPGRAGRDPTTIDGPELARNHTLHAPATGRPAA